MLGKVTDNLESFRAISLDSEEKMGKDFRAYFHKDNTLTPYLSLFSNANVSTIWPNYLDIEDSTDKKKAVIAVKSFFQCFDSDYINQWLAQPSNLNFLKLEPSYNELLWNDILQTAVPEELKNLLTKIIEKFTESYELSSWMATLPTDIKTCIAEIDLPENKVFSLAKNIDAQITLCREKCQNYSDVVDWLEQPKASVETNTPPSSPSRDKGKSPNRKGSSERAVSVESATLVSTEVEQPANLEIIKKIDLNKIVPNKDPDQLLFLQNVLLYFCQIPELSAQKKASTPLRHSLHRRSTNRIDETLIKQNSIAQSRQIEILAWLTRPEQINMLVKLDWRVFLQPEIQEKLNHIKLSQIFSAIADSEYSSDSSVDSVNAVIKKWFIKNKNAEAISSIIKHSNLKEAHSDFETLQVVIEKYKQDDSELERLVNNLTKKGAAEYADAATRTTTKQAFITLIKTKRPDLAEKIILNPELLVNSCVNVKVSWGNPNIPIYTQESIIEHANLDSRDVRFVLPLLIACENKSDADIKDLATQAAGALIRHYNETPNLEKDFQLLKNVLETLETKITFAKTDVHEILYFHYIFEQKVNILLSLKEEAVYPEYDDWKNNRINEEQSTRRGTQWLSKIEEAYLSNENSIVKKLRFLEGKALFESVPFEKNSIPIIMQLFESSSFSASEISLKKLNQEQLDHAALVLATSPKKTTAYSYFYELISQSIEHDRTEWSDEKIENFIKQVIFHKNYNDSIENWESIKFLMISIKFTSFELLKKLWSEKNSFFQNSFESTSSSEDFNDSETRKSSGSSTEKLARTQHFTLKTPKRKNLTQLFSKKSNLPEVFNENADLLDKIKLEQENNNAELLRLYFIKRFNDSNTATFNLEKDFELLRNYPAGFKRAYKLILEVLEKKRQENEVILKKAINFLVSFYAQADDNEKVDILKTLSEFFVQETTLCSSHTVKLPLIISFKLFSETNDEVTKQFIADNLYSLPFQEKLKSVFHDAETSEKEKQIIVKLISTFSYSATHLTEEEKLIGENSRSQFFNTIFHDVTQNLQIFFIEKVASASASAVKSTFLHNLFNKPLSLESLSRIFEAIPVIVQNNASGEAFKNDFLQKIFLYPAHYITKEFLNVFFEKIPVFSWSLDIKKAFLNNLAFSLNSITLTDFKFIIQQIPITESVWSEEFKVIFLESIFFHDDTLLDNLEKIHSIFPTNNSAFWTKEPKLAFLENLFSNSNGVRNIPFDVLKNILEHFPNNTTIERQESPSKPSLIKFKDVLNQWIQHNLPNEKVVKPVWQIFSEKPDEAESVLSALRQENSPNTIELMALFSTARAIGALDEDSDYVKSIFPVVSSVEPAYPSKINVCSDWLVRLSNPDAALIAAKDDIVLITETLKQFKVTLTTDNLNEAKLTELYNTICLAINLGGDTTQAAFEVFASDTKFFTLLMNSYDNASGDQGNNPNNQIIKDILQVLFMANPTELFRKLSLPDSVTNESRVVQWYFLVHHLKLHDLMNNEPDVLKRQRIQAQNKLKLSDITTAITQNNKSSNDLLPSDLNTKKPAGWLFTEQKTGYIPAYILPKEYEVLRNIYEHQRLEFSIINISDKTDKKEADIRVEHYASLSPWRKFWTWTSSKMKLRSPYSVQAVPEKLKDNLDAKAIFEISKTNNIQTLVTRIINGQEVNAEPSSTYLLGKDTTDNLKQNLSDELNQWLPKKLFFGFFGSTPSTLMQSLKHWDPKNPLPTEPNDIKQSLQNLVKIAVKLSLSGNLDAQSQKLLDNLRNIFGAMNQRVFEMTQNPEDRKNNTEITQLIDTSITALFDQSETRIIEALKLRSNSEGSDIIANEASINDWESIKHLEADLTARSCQEKTTLLKLYEKFLNVMPGNKVIYTKMTMLATSLEIELTELKNQRNFSIDEISNIKGKQGLLKETYEKLVNFFQVTVENTTAEYHNLKKQLNMITEIVEKPISIPATSAIRSAPIRRVRQGDVPVPDAGENPPASPRTRSPSSDATLIARFSGSLAMSYASSLVDNTALIVAHRPNRPRSNSF